MSVKNSSGTASGTSAVVPGAPTAPPPAISLETGHSQQRIETNTTPTLPESTQSTFEDTAYCFEHEHEVIQDPASTLFPTVTLPTKSSDGKIAA